MARPAASPPEEPAPPNLPPPPPRWRHWLLPLALALAVVLAVAAGITSHVTACADGPTAPPASPSAAAIPAQAFTDGPHLGKSSAPIPVDLAVTLTPALLGMIGPRILSRRERAALAGPAATTGASTGAAAGASAGTASSTARGAAGVPAGAQSAPPAPWRKSRRSAAWRRWQAR